MEQMSVQAQDFGSLSLPLLRESGGVSPKLKGIIRSPFFLQERQGERGRKVLSRYSQNPARESRVAPGTEHSDG